MTRRATISPKDRTPLSTVADCSIDFLDIAIFFRVIPAQAGIGTLKDEELTTNQQKKPASARALAG